MGSTDDPVGPSNCKSQADRNKALDADGLGACTRHGLSVYLAEKHCQHAITLLPRLGPFIVAADLTPQHGVVMPTPSKRFPHHHTWWPPEGLTRHTLFAKVSEVQICG
jgi:hypothetical protein